MKHLEHVEANAELFSMGKNLAALMKNFAEFSMDVEGFFSFSLNIGPPRFEHTLHHISPVSGVSGRHSTTIFVHFSKSAETGPY